MEKKPGPVLISSSMVKRKKSKPISSLRRFNNCKRFIIPFSDLISFKAWDEIALSFA